MRDSLTEKTHIPTSELTPDAAYRLLSSIVVPRPIALVSTTGADGTPNLAPHSYFNAVSSDPPLVMVSASQGGDTAANLEATGEFVVNVVSDTFGTQLETTAALVRADVDEFELAGLSTATPVAVRAPLVAEAPIALECRVVDLRVFGDSLVAIGSVVGFHIEAELIGETGRVEPDRLRPLGRLGKAYTTLGEVFRLDRPTPDQLGQPARPDDNAKRTIGRVHLVGSIPSDTASEAMTACASTVGAHLAALPDGETGDRLDWTTFQAVHVFHPHPDLETISQPVTFAADPEAWRPGDLEEDAWLFRVRDGAGVPHFESLGYVEVAQDSYREFCALRDNGTIAPGIRFQVSLPAPQSAVSWWFHDSDDADRANLGYTLAMVDEVRRLCDAIPHHDLAIQWDACWETVVFDQVFDWAPSGDPMRRIALQTPVISMGIPDDVVVGYHFCYGSMHDEHFVEPVDLARCVELSNFVVNNSGRRIDFVHMPVPIDRSDDAYYRPLRDLRIGSCHVYLGLVHYEDGLGGAQERIATAQRYLPTFGVAAECGFGRMDPPDVETLLTAHAEAADTLDARTGANQQGAPWR